MSSIVFNDYGAANNSNSQMYGNNVANSSNNFLSSSNLFSGLPQDIMSWSNDLFYQVVSGLSGIPVSAFKSGTSLLDAAIASSPKNIANCSSAEFNQALSNVMSKVSNTGNSSTSSSTFKPFTQENLFPDVG